MVRDRHPDMLDNPRPVDLSEDAGEKAELETTLNRYQAALPAAPASNR